MPASLVHRFPHLHTGFAATKVGLEYYSSMSEKIYRLTNRYFDLNRQAGSVAIDFYRSVLAPVTPSWAEYVSTTGNQLDTCFKHVGDTLVSYWEQFQRECDAEQDFLSLFTEKPDDQGWSFPLDHSHVILDLPGSRLIDISGDVPHRIRNYTVVFAPRAGHHSNIAEKLALFLRDNGLSRMAIVEQKCADEIPMYIDGKRHYEGFEGQVEQYRAILTKLKEMAGVPSHLIAVCQPGPLLMSTLILNPGLGRSFGSAGSPMHTGAQSGVLTDFARFMGRGYIDFFIAMSGQTVSADQPGAGRKIYDGAHQVVGFYLLGMAQHVKNFKRLMNDLRENNQDSVSRQKAFYHWYNYIQHFPAGFIRDTYQRIFVKNELVKGTLEIAGRKVTLENYPGDVPTWALGGTQDEIAPPGQATAHMDLLGRVPEAHKLTLICEAGHMGLFRSEKILNDYYLKIGSFILSHSDLN